MNVWGYLIYTDKLISVAAEFLLVKLYQVSDCERASRIKTKAFLFQSLSFNKYIRLYICNMKSKSQFLRKKVKQEKS